jgi:hypothetical protein
MRGRLGAEMDSAARVGRVTGGLVLAHLVAGLIVPFVLLDRVRGTGGFLVNAATSPGQMRAAVILLFAGSAVAIGIAITALPVIGRCSRAAGLWLVALAVAAFSLQAVDSGRLLSLLSLSQEYASAGPARAELFQALGLVAGASRKWAHYSYLLVVGSWICLLYASLFRFRLVPRALAGLGLVAVLLQVYGVTLRALFGYPPDTRLAVPLAPAYILLAVWLLVKGFSRAPEAPEGAGSGRLTGIQ